MRSLNTIRGRKPSKTELVLNYMVSRPHEIFMPKQLAEELGLNMQTTVTALNRLAKEGAISKVGRGRFCYKGEIGKGSVGDIGSKPSKAGHPKIRTETAFKIYKAIYEMASYSADQDVIMSVTGLGIDDFDEDRPVNSIKDLVKALNGLVGEDIVHDIVNIVLGRELTQDEVAKMKRFLLIKE